MRILMIGSGERYHLEPLARCLKSAAGNIWLAVNDLREPAPGGAWRPVIESKYFDSIHHTPGKSGREGASGGGAGKKGQGAIPKNQMPAPWMCALRAAWHLYKRRRPRRLFAAHMEKVTAGGELLHLQSLSAGPVARWLVSSGRSGYVVSCWGSDVLRVNDIADMLVQKQVLERASVITVTSPELKEVVLAKFGRQLEPKMAQTFFNPGVDALRPYLRPPEELEAGSSRMLRVCVGHNGAEGGNHRRLVASFAGLSPEVKSRIELILPMTYGGSPTYCAEIRALAEGTGCKTKVLQTFMSDEEVLRLRATTDILIFAPVSDAFSATVTQALACGSVVVCGAWLPYRARVRAGFVYREIETPDAAGRAVEAILANWSEASAGARANRKLAFDLFCEENIGRGWISAYETGLRSLNLKNSCKP